LSGIQNSTSSNIFNLKSDIVQMLVSPNLYRRFTEHLNNKNKKIMSKQFSLRQLIFISYLCAGAVKPSS